MAVIHKAGQNIGALSDAMYERKPEESVRRIQSVLNLVKKYGAAACEDVCAAALELRVPEYRFVRRHLERHPAAQMALHQIDPLIRELIDYRDLIQPRIDFEDKTA